MSDASNLLIEIGTEELPPSALECLGEEFAKGVHAALGRAQLTSEHGAFKWYATPRRLAFWAADVACRQPDRTVERRGPSVAAAFDGEDKPTPAAQGFARSCGVDVGELERIKTDKGEWLAHRRPEKGEPAARLIPECI